MTASWMRLRGFLRKEFQQIRRDPSSILLALVMPLLLLFLFGYGVSLNPRHVAIAVVVPDTSPAARDVLARFTGTDYFAPVEVRSLQEARAMLRSGEVDGALHLRGDFAADAAGASGNAPVDVQLLLHGVDANRATVIRGYTATALRGVAALRSARGEPMQPPAVVVEARTWFNRANESRNFLVPGLIAVIMTLIGTLLTALVIAREWERGTMEGLLATPLGPGEFLLGKTLPYFVLGMLGVTVSVVGGVTIFDVPLRGSLWLLAVCSALFLLAALGLGLAFSAALRVQFVAAQAALIAGFLPAFFLSGIIFDLESTPEGIQWISRVVPARYFVEISHTLFLAGDVYGVVLPAALALAVAAVVFFVIARVHVRDRLQ